jgi:hypothetical protein
MSQNKKEEGKMRAKIRADKTEDGYRMICILPTTDVVEYPQEGKVHPTKASVYADAAIMYGR